MDFMELDGLPKRTHSKSMAKGGLSVNNAGGNEEGLWTNELATHLPDQVVYVDHFKTLPFQNTMQGILMFLDISGFTSLCEKYSMNAKNGTDQLTKTLNGYMEALVHEVIKYDGDIMKFAGDAILTVWKVDAFSSMRPSVFHVIKCAMSIQRKYGEWTTNVGVKLRVKIGIAAGEVNIAYLGNSEFRHYVTMGRAVEAVNLAEKFCVSGDTVVSPTAWCHCTGLPIEHEVLEDNKHIKIFSVEPVAVKLLPYEMTRTKEVSESTGNLLRANINTSSANQSESQTSLKGDEMKRISIPNESSSPDYKFRVAAHGAHAVKIAQRRISRLPDKVRVRNAVRDDTFSDDVNARLSLYVAQPVLTKMEEQQPLAYLSEMRQVTILFMNLVLHECSKYELCFTMQTAFNIIHSEVKKMQGCMNKIFMFDKGSTFLVIFGFPGFKHENDCGHALQCAHILKRELDQVDKIERTSIGVTTGSTFCGVVGHNHRHEYTVIGRKVNMAARLMMYYPDKITCDSETYHHSKIGKGNFVHLDLKEMKGLTNVGTIREYQPCSSPKDNINALLAQELEYPIVGRDKEIGIFEQEIKQILNNPSKGSQRQVLVFEGESGIGKTKFIDAISAISFKHQIRVLTCTLSMQDAKLPYYAVKSLILDFLGFAIDQTHQEREHLLRSTCNDPLIIDNLCILNDILQLKVPIKESVKSLSSKERGDLLIKVLFHVVRELSSKKGLIIFTIDDAHYMDAESWDFVRALGQDNQSLVVLTIRVPFKQLCPMAYQVLQEQVTLRVSLSGLDHKNLAPLACQLLGAKEIPERLLRVLSEKSNGVPSWCEQLLTEMVCEGVLKIVPSAQARPTEPMVQPDPALLGGLPSKDEFGRSIIQTKDVICLMTTDISGVPNSIKGMIQARIDRMKELDQMVIKNASILGMSFSRVMLKAILPSTTTEEAYKKSLLRMAESCIFICATKWISAANKASVLRDPNNNCVCAGASRSKENIKLSMCLHMRFHSASTQETAYQMYLESNKRGLHAKAAKFLESQPNKCKACGGDAGIYMHISDSNDLRISPTKSRIKIDTDGEKSKKEGTQKKMAMIHETNLGVVRMFRPINSGTEAPVNTRRLSKAVETLMGGQNTKRRASNVREWMPQADSFTSTIGAPQTPTLNVSVGKLASALKKSRESESSIADEDSTVDVRECECASILVKLYPQMVYHWKAAGNIERTVHYLMEAAGACIATFDHMRALSYLRTASDIILAVKEDRNPFEGDVSHVDAYLYSDSEEARLESLLGQAHFHNGSIVQAFPHFLNALRLLNCYLPVTKMGIFFESFKERFRQWKHIHFPDRYLGKCRGWETNQLIEQARNLSHILHYYLMTHKKDMASLIVLKQVNAAEKADSDFHEVIVAYTSMIESCQVMNKPHRGQLYEFKAHARAIEMCHELSVDDQFTLAHLHCISLNSRLLWGQISEAVDSGYQAKELVSKLHDNDTLIQILPIFSQALLRANRLIDAVVQMRQLEYIQSETEDILAKAWFYACCLDSLLDLGFQIEEFSSCLAFAQEARKDATFKTTKLPLFYLACCITLWYQRKSQFRMMELWRELALETMPTKLENFLAVNGFVKILECKLILLSNCMSKQSGTRNKKLVQMLKTEIKTDIGKLEAACVKMPVFKVRLLHLKAYHKAILGMNRLAKVALSKCISHAEKEGNILEKLWAEHSHQVWFKNKLDNALNDFWLDHTEDDKEMPDWHLANDVEGSTTTFSLPLPHWFDN